MHIITQRLSSEAKQLIDLVDRESLLTLALVAEDRTRSRYRFMTVEGEEINLQLREGRYLKTVISSLMPIIKRSPLSSPSPNQF
jgi:urease accessory protein